MATARISDLVSQPGSSPSVERWAELCARLVALPARAPTDTLCQQLDEGLASWPDRLRIAPATWTRAAAAGQTPPFFSLVRTVDLGDLGEDAPLAEAVASLLAQPAMAAVRHLVADGLRLGEGGLRLLASSPCASGLRSLSLARAGLDATDIVTLSGASSLGGLVSLELRGNSVGLDGAKALAASTVLVNLRRLGLARTRLGTRGAAFLTKSEALSRLVEIDLAENGLTDANLELLVLSPFLAELAVLRLSGNHISRRGTLALAGSLEAPGFMRWTSGTTRSTPRACGRSLPHRTSRGSRSSTSGATRARGRPPARWRASSAEPSPPRSPRLSQRSPRARPRVRPRESFGTSS